MAEEATIRKIRTVQKEGTRSVARLIEILYLDAIISVGYSNRPFILPEPGWPDLFP